MDFWIILKNIGTIFGLIVSGSAVLAMIIKPIRKRFFDAIKTHSHTDESVQEIKEIKTMLEEHIKKDAEKSKQIEDLKKKLDTIKDSEQCTQRTHILEIYYKYLPTGEIPAYDYETLSKNYHSYKALDGNTFIEDIWNIVNEEWKKIPNR